MTTLTVSPQPVRALAPSAGSFRGFSFPYFSLGQQLCCTAEIPRSGEWLPERARLSSRYSSLFRHIAAADQVVRGHHV